MIYNQQITTNQNKTNKQSRIELYMYEWYRPICRAYL